MAVNIRFTCYGREMCPLSIENGGAVLYCDFVTIFRLASLQYIINLAMSDTTVPHPPKYKVKYMKTPVCGQ